MESQRALDTGMHGRAMRLALAGEPTADELKRGIRAEPVLRAVLAAAAQESPCRLVLQHPASVSFSAFAANSTRIVTACSDNQVRLWDAATGAQVAAWEHDGHINEVAIAEAAGHVATACRDGSTRVWSFGSDVPPRIFRHTDAVTCVAFSPDGKRLVSGSFDTFAIVWDVAAGDIVARFKHGEDLHSVQFSADSSMVLTASSDKFARLWSIESQAELRRFPHGNDRVYRALFSADGRRIATASEDSTAAVWDAATGERLAVLRHDYPVNAVAFSPDVSRIVTGSYDRTAKLWDGQTAKEITRLEHDDEVKHIAFSPDGAFVLTTAGDHTARLWSSATGDEMARFRHTESVAFGSFSDDGHTLVTASLDGTARVWQRGATAEIARVPWSIASTQVSESKPGAGNRNSGTRTIKDPGPDPKTIIVRNVADNQPVFELPHRFEVTGALFSPEGSRIATLSDDKIVRMWDAESGRPLLQLAHPEEVANVVFSADGTRLLTWTLVHGFGQRDVARLWDVETGVLRTRFDNGDVRSAEFGADGATLITHSDDGWSRTWDATFTVRLRGEALVRAVARDRLRGESRLTEEEVLILRPILGDKIERDVVGRWLGSSEYDAEIMTSLDQWRHNSQMAQKLITHA